MQQCAPVSAQPWDCPRANNQNLPQNKVLPILSGKSRSLFNFTAFFSSYSYGSSPQMALFGHLMCFFLVCLFFFLNIHRQCTVFEETLYSSIWKEGLLPRNHGLVMGLIISSCFWSLLHRMASFFLTVSVSQRSALPKLLPPMTDLLLSHLWIFFKYCRQQEADSKMLLYLDR